MILLTGVQDTERLFIAPLNENLMMRRGKQARTGKYTRTGMPRIGGITGDPKYKGVGVAPNRHQIFIFAGQHGDFMHYHCEVIMPPSSNIQETLGAILAPFNENKRDNGDDSRYAFWDWFVVGGRWAGSKESCRYDPSKLEQFYKELEAAEVTVYGLRCGKQELSPSIQIPMVDKIWNDLFPTENGEITPCPIFAHSNNQYDGNDLLACDICRVDEIPETLKCSRVIIAGPSYDGATIEAKFMLCEDQWNGVNHMPINWDGLVKTAVNQFIERVAKYREGYAAQITPKPDWICVTVDYHS